MGYLPAGVPAPQPSPEDAPFWEACRNRELKVRHCLACRRCFHPPMPSCPHCGSIEVDWKTLEGNGTVFSYTVAHHAVHPALKARVPYNVVVVALEDADDVRLVSNLVDADGTQIRIGEPVRVHWEEAGEAGYLPLFRRRTQAEEAA